MLVESWKFRCQRQILARLQQTAVEKPSAELGKATQTYACIVEADERIRLEGTPHRYPEDHIAGKGMNSLSHYKQVHKIIPMPQATKIPDAKAAVEKWDTLEKIPAGQLTKVRNKNEVIAEARNEGRKVHFSSLMDLYHLKNSELEPRFQKTEAESYSEVTL